MTNGHTEITVGTESVRLVLPTSFALLSDVVAASQRNQSRAFAAALGLCWSGGAAPKASLQGYAFDVMAYGGAVLDELGGRAAYGDILAAGAVAWSLCAAAILTETEVSDTEGFTEGAAGSTGSP
jgi:hypothetical protein